MPIDSVDLQSKLTFGGALATVSMATATAHRVAGSFKWEMKLNSIGYGPANEIQKMKPISLRLMVDTGSTISHFTPRDYFRITYVICKSIGLKGLKCTRLSDQMAVFGCKPEVFESLWF